MNIAVTDAVSRADSDDSRDPPQPEVAAREAVDQAVRQLFDAECALHTAHQTRTDVWISAAADQLHHAVVELVAAGRAQAGTRP